MACRRAGAAGHFGEARQRAPRNRRRSTRRRSTRRSSRWRDRTGRRRRACRSARWSGRRTAACRSRRRPRTGCGWSRPAGPPGASGPGSSCEKLRHAEPVDHVDRHEAAALRAHEQHVGVAVLRKQDRFRLGALGVRTALRVVPEAHAEMFELVAALVEHRAVEAEEREAAAAAVVVAFVGGGDAVAHPRHGVGLAEAAGLRVDEGDRVGHAAAGAHGVDLREVDRTGREVGHHALATQVDHHDVVVLLHRDHRLVLLVDVDELGLRVVREAVAVADERDVLALPRRRRTGRFDDRQIARGVAELILRHAAKAPAPGRARALADHLVVGACHRRRASRRARSRWPRRCSARRD